MNTRRALLAAAALWGACLACTPTFAHDGDDPDAWTSARPDGHAPIGVMGDHAHKEGELMLSLRTMSMTMDGNRDGTDSVSDSEVLSNFPVTPTEMTMEMIMVGGMYAVSNDLTVMAMLPYLRYDMDHVTGMGAKFSTQSEGLGDIKLSGLYTAYRGDGQQILLNAGISLPTGDIDPEDDTPAGPDQELPYPMRLGSGTYDLLPGITYLGQHEDWSWGGQLAGTVRLGRNDEGYSLGDGGELSMWGAYRVNDTVSTSLRIRGTTWDNIDGDDDDLNPNMISTADPHRRGGDRIEIGLGVNLYGREGVVKGHRLALEVLLPVYQDLDGPQLETDLTWILGYQYAW